MEEEAEDRISKLPDDILHKILSFLDILPVVQTSILSKRWTSIWSSLHVLNFNFNPNYEGNSFLIDFIYRVLLLRNSSSNIHTIRMSWTFGHMSDTWIRHALHQNIQVIDFTYATKEPIYDLPSCLLYCNSLKVLKLDIVSCRRIHNAVFVRLPPTVNLPNLTTLKLQSFCFNSSEFISNFLAGCPVLETLSIIGCFLHDKPALVIDSPRLKHLEISKIYACARDCTVPSDQLITEAKFVISAPSLKSFRCRVSWFHNSYEIDCQALVTAAIDLDAERSEQKWVDYLLWPEHYSKKAGTSMMIFLGGLYSSNSLTLSASIIEVISQGGESPPMSLKELRHLNMKMFHKVDCIQGVLHMLENSPNLETLVLDITKAEGNFGYGSPEDSSQCKFHDPKFMEILGGLHNLESLTSSAYFYELISHEGDFIPMSMNGLRHLNMKMFLSRDCIQGILHMLESSPKLETLALDITKVEGEMKCWKAQASSYSKFHDLKSIEIRNINGSTTELEFVQALLSNAVCLQKLRVFSCKEHNQTQIENFEKTLSKLQKFLPREMYCYFDSCICKCRD